MTKKLQEAETFGDWGKIAIAKYFAKIVKYEPKVLKDKDIEALHQMRVGMRSLRSALPIFDRALILPKTVSEKKVSKIAKILGSLRDIDVLQETLNSYCCDQLPVKEKKQLKVIQKQLEKQRKTAVKQVKKTLKSQTYLCFKQDLQHWLEHPQYHEIAAIAIEEILPDLLAIQVSQLLLHPGWLVGTKITSEEIRVMASHSPQVINEIMRDPYNPLHDLRKEIKKIRYNLAFFQNFYSNIYREYLQKIKLAQEVLGNIQDSIVLEQFLTRSFAKEIDIQLPTIALLLRETRIENWQEWLKLKEIFCDYRQRQEFRIILQYPRI